MEMYAAPCVSKPSHVLHRLLGQSDCHEELDEVGIAIIVRRTHDLPLVALSSRPFWLPLVALSSRQFWIFLGRDSMPGEPPFGVVRPITEQGEPPAFSFPSSEDLPRSFEPPSFGFALPLSALGDSHAVGFFLQWLRPGHWRPRNR